MSDTESTASIIAPLLKIRRAPFKSFSPILMDMAGAPPKPTQVPNEDKSVTMGPHTPTPASASVPTSGICPI